jgi:hypothetical protein
MTKDRSFIPIVETPGRRPGTAETGLVQAAEMFTTQELQRILKVSVKTIYGPFWLLILSYITKHKPTSINTNSAISSACCKVIGICHLPPYYSCRSFRSPLFSFEKGYKV